MPCSLFQGGRRRRRPRWRGRLVAVLLAMLTGFLAVVLLAGHEDDGSRTGGGPGGDAASRTARAPRATPTVGARIPLDNSGPAPLAGGGTAPSPLAVRLDDPRDAVALRFRHPPRSALLFDLDTGRVLWRHDPTRVLPIASLTKMMTALVVADRIARGHKVLVTKQALAYKGSAVGVLPRGKWIGVETMLHGLLLPSGNDAAIALAQRAARTVPRFVRLMNTRAHDMGLVCTRFSSPDGFEDRGNHSCAADLAAISRQLLRTPRLARIVRRRSASLPFPVRGGKISHNNNTPLLRPASPAPPGEKPASTDAAGRCGVASARRGQVRLGVV